MGYWGQTLQNGDAAAGTPYLRDYAHAAKTFIPNGYSNAPKLKFLFHVYFEMNPEAYNANLNTGQNFGLAVKTVKLPSYNFKTETLNQYNRKRIVQTKIQYNPVNMTFHDDNGNMMTRLWEAYYLYNYKDGANIGSVFNGARGDTPGSPQQAYNIRNTYKKDISGDSNWGYVGESRSGANIKVPFFKNIIIFGFNQHQFTAYTLINPVITSFSHDTYNYSDGGGTMELNMDLDYETVVYNEGDIDGTSPDNIVKGFGLISNYDRKTSTITPTNANGLAPGNGGYLPGSGGTMTA